MIYEPESGFKLLVSWAVVAVVVVIVVVIVVVVGGEVVNPVQLSIISSVFSSSSHFLQICPLSVYTAEKTNYWDSTVKLNY